MKTENEIAFADYKKSISYDIIEDIMINRGMEKSHIDIILYDAFAAGYVAAMESLLNKKSHENSGTGAK